MRKLFSKQARLPERYVEATIGAMPVGASGFTVPWAMWPDMDGLLWLNGHYTVHAQPGGTVSMLITRREDGYEVDATTGHAATFGWSPGDGSGFVGGADPLPVIRFKGA